MNVTEMPRQRCGPEVPDSTTPHHEGMFKLLRQDGLQPVIEQDRGSEIFAIVQCITAAVPKVKEVTHN